MNRDFLNKLADLLETIDQDNFDMGDFSNGDKAARYVEDICGTVACAIGYGPLIEPPVEDDYEITQQFSYFDYSERVTGLPHESTLWEFMFSSKWWLVDNTPSGAAQRIRMVGKLTDMEARDINRGYHLSEIEIVELDLDYTKPITYFLEQN